MAMQLNADGNEDLVLAGLDAAKEKAAQARNKAMKSGVKDMNQAAQLAAAQQVCDEMLKRDSILKEEGDEYILR